MNKKEFNNFFKSYAKNVDNANKQGFWKLSDALITQIIKDNIPTNSKKENVILDAGGGTGRWVCDLSEIYNTKFIIYDLSEDMLKRAKKNIKKASLEKRVLLLCGDLKKMKKIRTQSIDYIISIYSPISFIYKKDEAFSELFRVLKKGGRIIIMGHGFCNAIASKINNFCAESKELEILDKEKMVKWNKNVPMLNVFSRSSLKKDLEKVGFMIKKVYGVPVFVQPGPEDFDPKNIQKSKISIALEKKTFFKKIFDLEMKYNSQDTISDRGVNIIAIACKN